MVSYIFGGDTNLTPEDIKRQRMIANALAESRTPQNVGEGVGAVMRGIAGALVNARANSAERAGRKSAMDAFNPILAALSSQSTPDVTTATPDFSTNAAVDATPTKSAIKSPQDAIDFALSTPADLTAKPVEGTIENARKDDRATVPGYSSDVRGFQKVLRAGKGWTEVVGPDGKTLRREGARNWRNNNPGNIEYGDFAKKLGAIGTDGRFAVFPTYDMGRKAKEALLFENPNYRDRSISSAINRYAPPVENNTNAYISSVANAIGVDPGTPLSALTPQQRTVMLDAMQKVEGFRPGREIPLEGQTQQPVEVASLDGDIPLPGIKPVTEQVPVADVPEGFQQPDPLQAKDAAPVEVAQATTPKRARNEPSDEIVIKALMNPWLDDSQRAVAEMYYKQRISEREFQRKLEAERNDPKYKQDLEKGQLEIDKLKNPPKSRRMTEAEEAEAGLDTTGVYEVSPEGAISTIQKPKERKTATVNGRVVDTETGETISEIPLQVNPLDQDRAKLEREKFDWEKTKPTQDIREYQFYEEREKAAGRQPLGPLEWDQARRKAGAQTTTVNNNMKAESKFDEKLAEKQAETFSTMADDGINARADLAIIDQLDTFLKGQGGAMTGLSGALSRWGIAFDGTDDIQAADALINKLVPTQRAPGSGTMSDRDVELFKASLPSLWNQPGGNEKIIGVMRGMAEYKARQGEIADQVINGEMTRQEARRALRELPNPLEEFRNTEKDAKEASKPDAKEDAVPAGIDPEDWKYLTPEQKALFK